MDKNYFEEAFKRLSLLEDDFDISADADKVDELKSFIEDDIDTIPEEEIVDVNAETEADLADNYIGKVILECECCHSRIYKDEEDIVIDDASGLANIAEQCPVCNNELGYTVIGKIEPFEETRDIKAEAEDADVELPDDDVEVAEEEEVVEESLADRIARKHLKESKKVCPHCGKEPCVCESCKDESLKEDLDSDIDDFYSEFDPSGDHESGFVAYDYDELNRWTYWLKSRGLSYDVNEIDDPDDGLYGEAVAYLTINESLKEGEDCADCDESCSKDESLKEDFKEVEIKTDDQRLEMTSDEEGKVTVTTEPITNNEAVDEVVDDSLLDEPEDVENGEEEIVPLTSEEEVDIEANKDEETPEEDEVVIDDFDEESFDEIGESYMQKVYGNVNSYKTTKVREDKNQFIVEGLITFNSGAQKPTAFVFGNKFVTRRGKVVLEGYNKTFAKSGKAFVVRGSLKEGKFGAESMIYNYRVRKLNESTNSNETIKVYGRIKKK